MTDHYDMTEERQRLYDSRVLAVFDHALNTLRDEFPDIVPSIDWDPTNIHDSNGFSAVSDIDVTHPEITDAEWLAFINKLKSALVEVGAYVSQPGRQQDPYLFVESISFGDEVYELPDVEATTLTVRDGMP